MEYTFNKDEINSYIHKVFDMFNGKINCFNKAVLTVDWLRHYEHTNGGVTRNPNRVIIYPLVIARNSQGPNEFRCQLLQCIIHELFHCDQDIDYIRIITDMEYKRKIESAVEFESNMFIAYNKDALEKEFGLLGIYDVHTIYSMLEYFNLDLGYVYYRKTYLTHIISLIQDMIHMSNHELINLIIQLFRDPNSTIYLNINDNINNVCLKNKEYCLIIDDLNELLYNNIFRYNNRGVNATLSARDVNNSIWDLNLRVKGFDRIYKVTNE